MKVKNIFLWIILCVFLFNSTCFAYSSTRASYYLSRYSGSISVNSSNTITIDYEVIGTGNMDKIGALTVILEERVAGTSSWNEVKIYEYFVYPNMLVQNSNRARVNLTYTGNQDNSYRATITVYAEKNGGSDARTLTVYS